MSRAGRVIAAFVVVLAQAPGAASGAGEVAGGRPAECGGPSGPSSAAVNVWERAKSPELRRYCDLVASASSKLAGVAPAAGEALEAARQADRVLPGHAAPCALEGRALAALGRFDEARRALAEAASRDARALDDPSALLAWARALARTGDRDQAIRAYRALLPRAAALPSGERASAEVEAGLVAMAAGRDGLAEAVAALRQSVRDAQNETHAVAVLALALALDRRGDVREARAVLADRAHGDPRDTVSSARGRELLAVVPGDADAMLALALEPSQAVDAREAWRRSLAAAPAGPWADQARRHLAALGGAPPPSQGGSR